MNSRFERLRAIARTAKREVVVYQRVLRDPRTPFPARVCLAAAVGYLLFPFDLVPDFIPVLGQLDDALIVPGLVLVVSQMAEIDAGNLLQSEFFHRRKPAVAGDDPLFAIFIAGIAYADHPTLSDFRNQINVRFEFPGGLIKETNLTVSRCSEIFKQKPLPKDVWVDSYKIDWWVFAALQDLDLPFKTVTAGKSGGFHETTILQIGEHRSGPKGKWVYFVNGFQSPYHISTQTDGGIKNIKFVYEETK
jgi:uncharacterized membrane protein YkvA (DUF1232 family)